jgi:hypothetical protein
MRNLNNVLYPALSSNLKKWGFSGTLTVYHFTILDIAVKED